MRTPLWLGGAVAVVLPVVVTLLLALRDSPGSWHPLTYVGIGSVFGILSVLLLGALSGNEYRHAAIWVAIVARPNRTALAQVAAVSCVAGQIGLIASFGSLAAVNVADPIAFTLIDDVQEWQRLLMTGPVYALTAVYGLAFGLLLGRHIWAAPLAVFWPLTGESLVELVPGIGDDLAGWMPFANAMIALDDTRPRGPSAWGSLAYFAAVGVTLLTAAALLRNRRDA